MVQHALERSYEVIGVCRERSVHKLDKFKGRITIIPGATNDRDIIKKAVAGYDGVLTVLSTMGNSEVLIGNSPGDTGLRSPRRTPYIFCGWHITLDGQDVYSRRFKTLLRAFTWIGRLFRLVEIDDQVEACRRVFDSSTRWTVVRGSDLEEGESQGLPVWSYHVGDPILKSNITRRVDFALFMVEALVNDNLSQKAPAIAGCNSPSAIAHAADK